MSNSKVAVITGGGGVLGRATAIKLARDGYSITVGGRTQESLDETVEAVSGAGGVCLAVVTDVSDSEQVDNLFARSESEFGPCTSFLHSAATHGIPKRLANLTNEEWHHVIRTNLDSTLYGTRAALAQMLPQKHGAIVLVSSAGTLKGFPFASAYAATKSALYGIARTLAVEVGGLGVRVNVLVPGAMPESAIYQSAMPAIAEEFGYKPEAGVDILREMSALKRVCTPEEVAEGAFFLATERSSAMTGQALVVDGGLTV
jgi:NAD(P)-dependent dehydrogenase (short-subunit alcohol dehydrogenase family)